MIQGKVPNRELNLYSLRCGSTHCVNQAFALGKHLGLQCHVEMTPEMIRTWYTTGRDEIDTSGGPGVQQPEDMETAIEERVAGLNAVASRLYEKWLEGLAKG